MIRQRLFHGSTFVKNNMMTARGNHRKYGALYVAFLCCYFFYVIFPVTYTVPAQAHHGQAVKAQGHHKQARRSARLLLSDLLLSGHRDAVHDDETVSPGAGSGHILLIKKRALPSSQKNMLFRPTVSAVVLPANLFPEEPSAAARQDDHSSVRAVKGFHLCHSGIAPPTV
jgi:hypothetical protein